MINLSDSYTMMNRPPRLTADDRRILIHNMAVTKKYLGELGYTANGGAVAGMRSASFFTHPTRPLVTVEVANWNMVELPLPV